MPEEPEVIGCTSETYGEEICECCRGRYYNSDECKRIRKGEEDDYQMIYAKPDDSDSVRVFIIIHNGIINTVEVCADSDIVDTLVNKFLKDQGYSDIDKYSLAEMDGHLDTEFKVYSKSVITELV